MNFLVDGRAFVRTSAGIAAVLRCVLVSWANSYPNDKLYVMLPKKMHDSVKCYNFPRNIVWIEPQFLIFRYLPNVVFLFLMTPILIHRYRIDIYYTPVPTLPYLIPRKVKTIVQVHDVVNLEYSNTMYLKNIIVNALFFKRAVINADLLWAVSQYTKERIDHYFPKRKCEDIFVGSAIDRNIFKKLNLKENDIMRIKKKHGINDKFILFVGSLEPRKNLPFLLKIIPKIYSISGTQLVVVGANGWKNSDIFRIVNGEGFPKQSTIFCGYLSNEELVELYNTANCFVSASFNEGFGLPQLEAFICGCPVVTAENSAMIEISRGKSGSFLIKDYNEEEWISAIITMINTPQVVKHKQFSLYDWDVIINNLMKRIMTL